MNQKRSRLSSVFACMLAFGITTPTYAEQVAVPLGQQGTSLDRDQLPQPGMTMDQVYTNYGAAVKESPAVGEPPISKWSFSGFTVYFEHKTVLHVVVHHTSS